MIVFCSDSCIPILQININKRRKGEERKQKKRRDREEGNTYFESQLGKFVESCNWHEIRRNHWRWYNWWNPHFFIFLNYGGKKKEEKNHIRKEGEEGIGKSTV